MDTSSSLKNTGGGVLIPIKKETSFILLVEHSSKFTQDFCIKFKLHDKSRQSIKSCLAYLLPDTPIKTLKRFFYASNDI